MERQSKILSKLLQQIGKKLAALRKKSGYSTLKEFATENNLAPIQYWKIENGKTNLTMKTLNNILLIHKVKMKDFFTSER